METYPRTRAQHLRADLLYFAFQVLAESDGEMRVDALFNEVFQRVELDELAQARSFSGRTRWKTVLHWISVSCVHLGLLEKRRGTWQLTDLGLAIAKLSRDDLYSGVFGKSRKVRTPEFFDSGPESDRIISMENALDIRSFQLAMASRAPNDTPDEFHLQQVFFATNRGSHLVDGKFAFGPDRSQTVHYGSCTVSIPLNHLMGEVERPSLFRMELNDDPKKHIVLQQIVKLEQQTFFAKVAQRISGSSSKHAFIFIHGYNVSFEDAALRTAQISHDLNFDGAPLFFSWPSAGSVEAYMRDENNIEWAKPGIKTFLMDFLSKSEAEKVFLIGHSMGNRGLAWALKDIVTESPEIMERIAEIILTAPDIDAAVFTDQIAPAIVASNTPLTLYASSGDKALAASKNFHGYRRAGDSKGGVTVLKGMETIDATGVDTSFLGHSYVGSARTILSDLFYLINLGARARTRFGLVTVDSSGGEPHWRFRL